MPSLRRFGSMGTLLEIRGGSVLLGKGDLYKSQRMAGVAASSPPKRFHSPAYAVSAPCSEPFDDRTGKLPSHVGFYSVVF